MEPCLIDNNVCPNGSKRCKVCKFDECKQVLNMIDTQEEIEKKIRIKEIYKQLPKQCKNCSFLIITDLDKQKVYCPYRIKDKCILNKGGAK